MLRFQRDFMDASELWRVLNWPLGAPELDASGHEPARIMADSDGASSASVRLGTGLAFLRIRLQPGPIDIRTCSGLVRRIIGIAAWPGGGWPCLPPGSIDSVALR